MNLLGQSKESDEFTYQSLKYDGYAQIDSIKGNTLVDSGSLLSFTGTKLKTVGFNQWDEEWEQGLIDASTGQNTPSTSYCRSKNYMPIMLGIEYFFAPLNKTLYLRKYDANKQYLRFLQINANSVRTFTMESDVAYIRFCWDGTTYDNNICINISDRSKNGTYEPYHTSTLSLPISTYFPTGMKSAGSVYDELTKDKAISRVGTRTYQSGDENDATLTTDGTNTNYPLTTPTEVSISPELDLHYAIEKGGTELLLPENTSTPTTSPLKRDVTFMYEYDTVDNIISLLNCIAQVETSPTTHAYSSGDYLMYNYKLYRVTSSIANGGTLTVGTNITETKIMDELLSLTA